MCEGPGFPRGTFCGSCGQLEAGPRIWSWDTTDTNGGETSIRPFLLIASQCQGGTFTALAFVSFALIELLKENKLPLVVCVPVRRSMCLRCARAMRARSRLPVPLVSSSTIRLSRPRSPSERYNHAPPHQAFSCGFQDSSSLPLTGILSGPRMSPILFCLLSDTDCSQEPRPVVQPPVPPPLQLLPV